MKFIKIILFFLILSACNFDPKPDKTVELIIELQDKNLKEQQIHETVETFKRRLQKITSQYEVVSLNTTKIQITAATHYESDRFKKYILNPGKLKFYEVYKKKDIVPFLMEVNELAKNDNSAIEPLFELIKGGTNPAMPNLLSVVAKDTTRINKFLSIKAAESKLPVKRRYVKFLWGTQEKGTGYFPLYALRQNNQNQAALHGDVVVNAFTRYNELNIPVISMQMNEEGSEKWADLTERAFQQRSNIAIVLNDQVYSAPGVISGPIHGGRSEISGDFTVEQTQDFANILMSGEIPKLKVLSFNVEEIK
ncbi:SecDF P1 head subdomain-containing protein [Aquimarina litoralis]|uniref:SecDF P1 head subdomain-containing protein n=1 Tax=Aquimarina litoralis TaxID=584605 RepID=UPI0031DC099C